MIRALVHTKGRPIREELSLSKIAEAAASKSNTLWIDVDAPTKEELDALASKFSISELTISDILKNQCRPKVEQFDNYSLIVLRAFAPGSLDKSIQFSALLFSNALMTISADPVTSQDELYEYVRKNPGPMALGMDFVLYEVLARIIDSYSPYIKEITESLDELENETFERPDESIPVRLFDAKKQLYAFRKEAAPLQEITDSISSLGIRFVSRCNAQYFQDASGSLASLLDAVDSSMDLANSLMEASLLEETGNTNRSLRRIAAIALILLPPILLAAIFGMKFQGVPFSDLEMGFYLALMLILSLLVSSYYYFKRIDWI